MAGLNIGASLASYGQGQKQEATEMLGRAAEQETTRNQQNKQLEAQRKAGNRSLGATAGALAGMQYGSALGPWGAVIGGAIGYVASGLFD